MQIKELLLGDSTKARKHLGWKPNVDFPVSTKSVCFDVKLEITIIIIYFAAKGLSEGYDGFRFGTDAQESSRLKIVDLSLSASISSIDHSAGDLGGTASVLSHH